MTKKKKYIITAFLLITMKQSHNRCVTLQVCNRNKQNMLIVHDKLDVWFINRVDTCK